MSTVLVSGLFVGLIYGLFAMGLVITYKGSRIVNFAHGETGMIGTFFFTMLWREQNWPLPLAIMSGVALSALLGVLVERIVARPLSNQSPLTAMLGTFAVAGIMLAVGSGIWGFDFRSQPPLVEGRGVFLGGIFIAPQSMFVGAVALVLLAGTGWLFARTWLGFTLRASAMSPAAGRVVGINVNRLSMITWAMGGAIAAIAGILISPLVSFNVFFMTALLVRGLSAALLAGLTNIPLAIAAGVAIAQLEAVLQYTTGISGLVEAVLTVAILGLLLANPRGLALRRAEV